MKNKYLLLLNINYNNIYIFFEKKNIKKKESLKVIYINKN